MIRSKSAVKDQGKRIALADIAFGVSVVLLLLGTGIYILRQPWDDRDKERFEADASRLDKLQTVPLPALPATNTAGRDWPQWRGRNRDGVATETGLRTDWPADGLPLVWKAKTGAGYSALAIAHNRAYTIVQDEEAEAVVCWDATGGAELWRFRYPCKYVNGEGSGPRSTPTVAGDRVYTVGATGIFHCLEATTGKKVWRHDLLEEFHANNLPWGVSFSPLVDGDLVFTMPGGPGGNSLAAFHKDHGTLAWKALDGPAGYSSPLAAVLAGRPQIVFFTGDAVLGVAGKDGSLYWRYPWATEAGCNIATPIIAGNYVFISSGYNHGCAVLEIVADADGQLHAEKVYEHNRMRNHFGSSVLHHDHIYGFDEGFLVCMNLRTGKICWKERGFGKGTLLSADGHLIVLGDQGKLALVAASPEAFRQEATLQVSRKRCWIMPALAHGKLYVRDEEQVQCLDVSRK
jgi:outer membrane protein assembly factor BamB